MSKKYEGKGKKRKKNYYVQFQKKQRTNTLEPGTRGFLLTCNNDERRCIREVYNLLNEYEPSEPQEERKEQNMEEELRQELEELRGGSGTSHARAFQQLYTGIQSCLFVQTKLEPYPVLLRILEDIRSRGQQKTIATQKMFPVLATCKAHLDNLRKTLKEVIDQIVQQKDVYLTDRKLQYAVLFRARHNNSMKKDEVVTTVIDMVRSEGVAWEPEPRTADCAVSVDVLNGICCISVLPHYEKYKRYNLVELAKTKPRADDDGHADSAEGPTADGGRREENVCMEGTDGTAEQNTGTGEQMGGENHVAEQPTESGKEECTETLAMDDRDGQVTSDCRGLVAGGAETGGEGRNEEKDN